MAHDPYGYLGHFRDNNVLSRGHNVGAPRKEQPAPHSPDAAPQLDTPPPKFNAETNPVAATKQANRSKVDAAIDTGGDVKTARGESRTALADAWKSRTARDTAGFAKSDREALLRARAGKSTAPDAAPSPTPTEPKVVAPATTASRPKPRGAVKTATKEIRTSRRSLRDSVAGGDLLGAWNALGGMENAKATRKAARKLIRSRR